MNRFHRTCGIAATIMVLAACTHHSQTTHGALVRSDYPGLSFTHPKDWLAQPFAESSTFTVAITFLSTARLHNPCRSTEAPPGAVSVSCGWPIDVLAPGGVFVSWTGISGTTNPPDVENPNTTIGGRSARRTTERPGRCGQLHADETVTVDIDDVAHHYYEMTACLRGPGLRDAEQRVDAMLASVTFTS